MKDEFYMVLPSNSSMNYYPENVTTRYTTHLSQCMSLHGSWAVSLAEIHIPMTVLHVPSEGERNFMKMVTVVTPGVLTPPPGILMAFEFKEDSACVPPGIYNSIETLIDIINEIPCVVGHLKFKYARNGYVTVSRVCESCVGLEHSFCFSDVLNKVLGFTGDDEILVAQEDYIAQRPASLANGTPNMMYVYTDICEPYITGDVYTPLLRVVPAAAADNRNYGSVKIRSFSPLRYVPLLRTSFQTITIDIRDEFGEPIPFEHGTLTVTLHFKRTD